MSIAELREDIASRFNSGDADALNRDGRAVLSFAAILGQEQTLRQLMADPALDAGAKRAALVQLLEGKIEQSAFDVISHAVNMRWSSDADMIDAIDESGQTLLLMASEVDGSLDAVEEEIFRFGRIVSANADLQMALSNPATSATAKSGIVESLLGGKADPNTVTLLRSTATQLHGRPIQDAIERLSELAATRRGRIVADVRSAIALSDEQQSRLATALSAIHHREVQLQIHVDPSVIGGLVVRIGDEVIDGTMSTRLTTARRRLTH